MEYHEGQELHIGEGISGIIFHVNETQITMMNWNGETKIFYKEFLDNASKLGDRFFKLSDEVSEDLKDIYEEAMKMHELIQTYTKAI